MQWCNHGRSHNRKRFYATKLSNLSGGLTRLNSTLDKARNGAKLIGENLARKRLKSNYSRSKDVLLGSKEFKEKTRREAKEKPIMMGSHKMEESPEEKYLGDQIHTDGIAASILSTINKWLGKCISKINEIMNLSEHQRMAGMRNCRCARTLYIKEIVSSILNNSESRNSQVENEFKLKEIKERLAMKLSNPTRATH